MGDARWSVTARAQTAQEAPPQFTPKPRAPAAIATGPRAHQKQTKKNLEKEEKSIQLQHIQQQHENKNTNTITLKIKLNKIQ